MKTLGGRAAGGDAVLTAASVSLVKVHAPYTLADLIELLHGLSDGARGEVGEGHGGWWDRCWGSPKGRLVFVGRPLGWGRH